MACSMYVAAVFLLASAVAQADQCSSGSECKSSNEPQRFVSLLQTKLQINVFEENVEDAKGKGKAKAKPKEDKQAELAGGRVLDEQSQWISCAFNWTTLSHAHVASSQWGFITGLEQTLRKQREDNGIAFQPISSNAQSTVPERLEPLLQIAASMLDLLDVNWYLAFGAELGYLRSGALIAWDEDVDLLVKKADRIKVCDFIKEGGESKTNVFSGTLSVFRSVPEHPEWLMAGYYDAEGTCHKVIWVDVETEVAIDMCIDCGDTVSESADDLPTERALFGNVEVNVPKHPFHGSIQDEAGVDKALREITMKTSSGQGWTCTRYECGGVPPTGSSAASLEDVYSTNPSAMRGPFDFHIDTSTSLHTTAECSLPRNFESCSAELVALKEVSVRPCQSSPWASSVSPPVTLVNSALIETKQVVKYQLGPWMVVQLQTQ